MGTDLWPSQEWFDGVALGIATEREAHALDVMNGDARCPGSLSPTDQKPTDGTPRPLPSEDMDGDTSSSGSEC